MNPREVKREGHQDMVCCDAQLQMAGREISVAFMQLYKDHIYATSLFLA